MAVLETLQIVFEADASGAQAQIVRLTAAVDALSGAAERARGYGLAVSEGFAQGILAGQGAAVAAAVRVANAAAAKLRAALEIHSPSRVTREVGLNFAEGFAGGISDALTSAENASRALSASATAALQGDGTKKAPPAAAAAAEPGEVNIVVPLMLDGMRLGEACIRSINAVTRAAGEVLLEL